MQAVTLSFLHSCNPAVRIAALFAFLNAVNLSALIEFLPSFKHKEPINCIRLYACGSVWLSKAVFGTAIQYNTFVNRALLCTMIFINGFMQKAFDKSEGNGNGIEPFFPVTFNPSRRADFCVQQNTASCVLRHSKPS